MDHYEAAVAICSGVSRARWQPTIQIGQRHARRLALEHVVSRVPNVLMHDAVSVQVWCVAHPTVPTTIVPS